MGFRHLRITVDYVRQVFCRDRTSTERRGVSADWRINWRTRRGGRIALIAL